MFQSALLAITLVFGALNASGARAQSTPIWEDWYGTYSGHTTVLTVSPTGWVEFDQKWADSALGFYTIDAFQLTSKHLIHPDDQLVGPGAPADVWVAAGSGNQQLYNLGNGVLLVLDPAFNGLQAQCSPSTDVTQLPPALAAQNVCTP